MGGRAHTKDQGLGGGGHTLRTGGYEGEGTHYGHIVPDLPAALHVKRPVNSASTPCALTPLPACLPALQLKLPTQLSVPPSPLPARLPAPKRSCPPTPLPLLPPACLPACLPPGEASHQLCWPRVGRGAQGRLLGILCQRSQVQVHRRVRQLPHRHAVPPAPKQCAVRTGLHARLRRVP